MTLGKNLKKLRIKHKWNQEEVARRLNITPGSYGMYEQNRRSPNPDMLKQMSQLFNVSTDELLDNRIAGDSDENKQILKTLLQQSESNIMFATGGTIDDLSADEVAELLSILGDTLDVTIGRKMKNKE